MSPEYQSDQHLCDRKTLAGDRRRRPHAGQNPVTPHGVSERPRLPPVRYPRRPRCRRILTVSKIIRGVRMDETTQATHAKDEFFAAGMHMFHVTGFSPPPDVLTRKAEAPQGARLDVWPTDPASDLHIPAPGAEGVAFSTPGFSLVNSGNRTLRTPKRSWKIDAGGRARRRRSPGRDDDHQSQVDVQRSVADAGGTGLAAVPARGRSRGPAHLCEARIRRHLLRAVLRHRAGGQEVPEGSLRRQSPRQSLQGLLRGRRMRHPGTPRRRRRG